MLNSKLFVALFVTMISLSTQADSAVVRESIARYFSDERKSVDMSRLSYFKEPSLHDGILIVESQVWAEERLRNGWTWHECQTKLKQLPTGSFTDLGTNCLALFD